MQKSMNSNLRKQHAAAILAVCALIFSCTSSFAASSLPAESSSDIAALPDAPEPQSSPTMTPSAPDTTMQPPASEPGPVTARGLPKNFLRDQEAIWTSPAHIRVNDLNWMVPMAAVTALTLKTDRDAMVHVVSHNQSLNNHSVTASNAMLGIIGLIPAANLAYGSFGNHEHARETGLLGAETAADAAVVEQAMKLMFWRERPTVDNSNGKFWQRSVGTDSSFPSTHSVLAWSLAPVIAGEYPSLKTNLAVYALATGVSITRVMGQQHFPTDVVVGSAVGWLVGHYVYKVRHRWADRQGYE